MGSIKKRKPKKSTSPKVKKIQSSAVTKKNKSQPSRVKKAATPQKKASSPKKKTRRKTAPVVKQAQRATDSSRQHRLIFFVTLLFIGLTMMIGGTFYWLYRQTILSFKVAPVYQVTAENRGSEPQRVKIGTANIDLPVTPAHIVGGVWETSDTTATHLVTSARPGEKSNIVIYGHNRDHLFKALHDVQAGETVTLVTEDGNEYHYQVSSKTVVTPDQIEVVLPTEKEELTLYTCTGFLDTKRLVIKATPVSVSYSL
ncbi:MAG TPA: sortase [Patescibacteria group bacterium]